MASLHSSQMDLVSDFVNYCNSHNSPRMLIYTGKLFDFNFLLFASCRQWSCPPIHGDHPFPWYSLGKDSDPTYPYCLSQPQQFPTTPISQYDKTSTCKCENDDVEFLSDFLVYCSHFCTVRSHLEVPDGEGWGSSVGRFPMVFPCFPLMRRLGQGRGTVGSLHVVG